MTEPVVLADLIPSKEIKPRIYYIDNIRIVLTILVVLFHAARFQFVDFYRISLDQARLLPVPDGVAAFFIISFQTAILQSFFMAVFFFVSGYFVPTSYTKRGATLFLKERVIRLLIPLAVNDLVLTPVLVFGINAVVGEASSFADYYSVNQYMIGGGVGWFIGLLFLFNVGYVLWQKTGISFTLPTLDTPILIAAILTTLLVNATLNFLWRMIPLQFPIMSEILQLSYVTTYALFFALGCFAKSFVIPVVDGAVLLKSTLVCIIIMVGGFFAQLSILDIWAGTNTVALSRGGGTWQSFAWALWELLILYSTGPVIFLAFAKWINFGGKVQQSLAENTYCIYLIHSLLLLVAGGILFAVGVYTKLPVLVRYLSLAIIGFPLSWGLSILIRKIPGVKHVL
jgi:glucans biosynthesis protein C